MEAITKPQTVKALFDVEITTPSPIADNVVEASQIFVAPKCALLDDASLPDAIPNENKLARTSAAEFPRWRDINRSRAHEPAPISRKLAASPNASISEYSRSTNLEPLSAVGKRSGTFGTALIDIKPTTRAKINKVSLHEKPLATSAPRIVGANAPVAVAIPVVRNIRGSELPFT